MEEQLGLARMIEGNIKKSKDVEAFVDNITVSRSIAHTEGRSAWENVWPRLWTGRWLATLRARLGYCYPNISLSK